MSGFSGGGFSNRSSGGSDIKEETVSVRRVSHVVKGGRRFGFSAMVVVGDRASRVGYAVGKDQEVSAAISKAARGARRNMVKIPLKAGRTLHHRVFKKCGATKILIMPAPEGTGIVASGSMRKVLEGLGVGDVVAKRFGSSNPVSVVRATFAALKCSSSPAEISEKRGKKISEIIEKRNN